MSMDHLNYVFSMFNPVFCTYAFWASVLIIKMLLMAALTAIQRFKYKSFVNTEDCNKLTKANEPQFNDPHVERVRRAHLNDMENILPYLIIGGLFVITDPKPILAIWMFRIAAFSRIFHTIVYAFGPVPQPCRFLGFVIAYLINIFMAIYVLFFTIRYI